MCLVLIRAGYKVAVAVGLRVDRESEFHASAWYTVY